MISKELITDLIENKVQTSDFWDKRELLESPIEEYMFDELFKYKSHETELHAQQTIKTISGNFRPDIVLKNGNKLIAIECDGKDFHEDDFYDEWRDVLILSSSKIETIFRLRGRDINSKPKDLIYFMANKEPDFFNIDMVLRLKNSLIPPIQKCKPNYKSETSEFFEFEDLNEAGKEYTNGLVINWRNIERNSSDIWIRQLLISYLHPGEKIKELKEHFSKYNSLTSDELEDLYYTKYPRK